MEDHKANLITVGIEWEDSDGQRLDFHSIRHTYGTPLSKAGVLPHSVMSLMRHSDIRLTLNVYTNPKAFDLAGDVEKLPTFTANSPAGISENAIATSAGIVNPLVLNSANEVATDQTEMPLNAVDKHSSASIVVDRYTTRQVGL